MNVIEIGCVPPGYGGVAVHLQRLLAYLTQQGIPHLLYDIGGTPKTGDNIICSSWGRTVRQLLVAPRAVVHFHNFSPRNLLFFRLLGLRHFTVLSLHNERFVDELNESFAALRRLYIGWLNRLDAVVVPSDDCRNLLIALITDYDKIHVCPAFIPPPSSDTIVLPDPITEFRRRHKFVVASSAFEIRFHDGADLYGIDVLIEMAARLRDDRNMNVGVVFLLPSVGDEHYFQKLRARIAEVKLDNSFLFWTQPLAEACALWRLADLVIRATNTDGDPLMVREALWCGTPVVASDCVPRVPEAVTFHTRDADDLVEKVALVLHDLSTYQTAAQKMQPVDNAAKLVDIYRDLQRREAR